MATFLINIRGASDEEVSGMETLLQEQGIAHYRTDAGRWRLGVEALWLNHRDDYTEARALIDQFQETFSAERRELWQQLQAQGQAPGFLQYLFAHPFKASLTLLAIGAVLAVSLLPFIGW